jgi:L,D-transpeptidase catalytic domain
MTCFEHLSSFGNSGRKPALFERIWLRPAWLAVASSAVIAAAGGNLASAAGVRNERAAVYVDSRSAGAPVMAVVSLSDQRVTVYDSNGWIMRAPVSSGQKGRETPAGIFSVIEKQAEHYSNLYDDAFMPHMQRITWSGIALHGGPLPGYPASHGCIRMPYDFASRLFDVTKVGMRVIVAPGDVAPVEIAHPTLFPSKPGAADAAAARAAEAAEAASKADQAKHVAATASREASQAIAPVRAAETLKRKAETQLAAAERAVVSARSDDAKRQAEDAKAMATANLTEAEAQLAAAKATQQSKLDAVASARQASAEAETQRAEAAEAARKAAHDLEPASVFISLKTQRLYVRQAFQPILESPVTIRDPDRPIGTHVFTAIAHIDGTPNLRWNVVSLDHGRPAARVAATGPAGGNRSDIVPALTDADGARAALDRITIPADVADRIAGIMSPRSSLIVSDEALSAETGKGTEFIVLLGGEPQGGIKFRRRSSPPAVPHEYRYDRPVYWRSPF